ncbi:MAG: sigma-54-dependent Fis family transcriptional regulator [Oligoflexia bacterium]|nr:sigma-54-dependent Fis family transcriptional regulator [Oligoflexia bacterium]
MNGLLTYTSDDIQKLMSILYSSLDESLFFSELSKFIKDFTKAERVTIYKANPDESIELTSVDGRHTVNKIKSGEGILGHVVKTKRAYFSNMIRRDPLYNKSHYPTQNSSQLVIAELCIPIVVNNQVIAVINFQSTNSEVKYDYSNINAIQNILTEIKRPLINLQMYLASKHLNDVLNVKLEQEIRSKSPHALFSSNIPFYKKMSACIQDVSDSSEVNLIGNSLVFQKILGLADSISKTRNNVLINGNSGVGKLSLAYHIYNKSKSKTDAKTDAKTDNNNEKLILVDCLKLKELVNLRNSVPSFATTINSSEENPLTEAFALVKNNGTIILKNIHNMPLTSQIELLNTIEKHDDIRIIITTSHNVDDLIQKGKLNKQLMQTLNYFQITIPALNERMEDLLLLVDDYLNNKSSQKSTSSQNNQEKVKVVETNDEVKQILQSYNWPGNIKELWKILNCAITMTETNTITASHLPDFIKPKKSKKSKEEDEMESFELQTLDLMEKKYIVLTLHKLKGNKSKTAKALGITIKTLYNKLHYHGMSDFIKK